MALEDQTAPRRDGVVIMARGASRRMGVSKGLLTLPGDATTFARRIVQLYEDTGWPLVLVTLPELVTSYAAELEGCPLAVVRGETAGGDTARTVHAGWKHLAENAPDVTHVWAHPVDLPLVRPETLGRLLRLSRENPQLVVRPEHEGTPGHPVVLPPPILAVLATARGVRSAPLRSVLVAAQRLGGAATRTAAVTDEGTVKDFDVPADLGAEPRARLPGKDDDHDD